MNTPFGKIGRRIADNNSKKIAVLGATGNIAKGLIYYLIKDSKHHLYLYARSLKKLEHFLGTIEKDNNIQISEFNRFPDSEHDVIINCVGTSNPEKINNNLVELFNISNFTDELILNYLNKNPKCVYISLSSGAVYGSEFTSPSKISTPAKFEINPFKLTEFYGLVKLCLEAKHRVLERFNIVDLRVFNFFSRFSDLSQKLFINSVINCDLDGKELVTTSENIVRDYINTLDLLSLIMRCAHSKRINKSYDVYSRKPIEKFELLYCFSEKFGLKYRVDNEFRPMSATGIKKYYYSVNKEAEEIGYGPLYTSMETLIEETEAMID